MDVVDMADLSKESLGRGPANRRLRIRVLMRPGLGLKRWLALLSLGLALFSLGVGFAMTAPGDPAGPGVFPAVVRSAALMLAGMGLGGVALHRIYGWVVRGASQSQGGMDILAAVEIMQNRGRGPRVVAIGGGTGVSTLLRGIKRKTGNLTAIVTIADDGGSSGRLRDDLHMPPPGDARNCLIALSEASPLMEELFDYRFNADSNLGGHSLGNLLLAALYEKRGGFQEGLEAAAEILAVSGRVVPVSNNIGLVLMGETVSGRVLKGESAVGHAPDPLRRIWLEPAGAVANEAALEAIRQAELIVIGPGSLYTSIIPNFLLPEIGEAVAASQAPTVFVCNVATQPYETDGLGAGEHLRAFQAHSGVSVSHVVVNSKTRDLPQEWGQAAVPHVSHIAGFKGAVIAADVVNDGFPTRHDPYKLADVLMSIERSQSNGRPKSRETTGPVRVN